MSNALKLNHEYAVGVTLVVQQNHTQLPLKAVALYTFFPFQQIIVRLRENLNTEVLFVTISVNGSSSKTARFSIKP